MAGERADPAVHLIGRPVAWLREDDGLLLLDLHVQPGAKRTAAAGLHGEGTQQRLKVRLAAPPVDGRANAELLRFLAEAFGVPLRNVRLLRGESSRHKAVRIDAPALRPDRQWASLPGPTP